MTEIENSKRFTIEVSGFDLKLILESLNEERRKRLSKAPFVNRNPDIYPPRYWYDDNAKPVRQVDRTINYIKKQIKDL